MEQEKREVPVYIFLGLLESGKTSVVMDFLSSNDFGSKACNLIICCEEGEEEYDEAVLEKSHSKIITVESASQLHYAFFRQLEEEYQPTTVMIEWNGMWDLKEFMAEPMPNNWFEFQNIGLIDASTYEVYTKNMKDRFMQIFRFSDIVVFNRCDQSTRQQDIRRNIRVLNKNARVYFESEDEDFVQEKPELPYDITKTPIEVSFDDYGALMADIQEQPEVYNKKVIKTDGFICCGMAGREVHTVFGRMGMACCADDMMFLGFTASGDCFKRMNARKNEKIWGSVTGRLTVVLNPDAEIEDVHIEILEFKKKSKPEDTVVYFN